ncbi:hypothetical protein SAMN05428988_3151 [Chitinophaga sp. YR573]|uniref:hypothetical protein n=1 Tax=Chitinophaga sp. YR573 TaxID=1881040 RepID=UPI0008B7C5E6|nr:hypothetical protein [Chitinophaga sp. YR573]SEW20938.1 hypothetical protein SAMN05428988_3151 [Chitinophaga sp. YR573]
MEKKEIKEKLLSIIAQYPTARLIVIQYYGAAGDFEEFSDVSACDNCGNPVLLQKEFLSQIESLLGHLIGYSGLTFDGNGSEGLINIDLNTMTLYLDNNDIYYQSSPGISTQLRISE